MYDRVVAHDGIGPASCRLIQRQTFDQLARQGIELIRFSNLMIFEHTTFCFPQTPRKSDVLHFHKKMFRKSLKGE